MTDEMKRALDLARELARCAAAWEPDVRLVGNLRADEIAAICAALLASEERCAQITKHAAHCDEEYATLKAVLRAEHAEVQRMRPVYERALAWHRCAESDAGLNGACSRHDRRLYEAVTAALDRARQAEGAERREDEEVASE